MPLLYYKAKPQASQAKGMDYANHYLWGWGRHVVAYLIGAGHLAAFLYLIDEPAQTEALSGVLQLWTITTFYLA